MRFNAAQHVSGVLTSKQSPIGQAGYRTLFYTHELLTQDELNILEQQAQESAACEAKMIWQSYRLSEQRHVLSLVTPIATADEFGRRGRFFTHSLVFNVHGGQQFDDALLDLLRPQNFLTSFDKVLACEALKTGHVEAISIEAKREWVNEAESLMREWSGEQLNQLYMLMSDPHRLIEQGQRVAFIGSESQILSALKIAFLLTPPTSRKFCTFDTNAPGSGAPSTRPFWGYGSSAASGADYVIDAAQRRVTIPELSPLKANGFSTGQVSDPVREAIVTRLSRPSEHMLRSLVNRKYTAFIGETLYRSLLDEPELHPTAADLELLAPFGQAHSGLGLLLALKSGNNSHRLQVLGAMDVRSYNERIKELRVLPDFKPWQAFCPILMFTWFELFRGAYSMEDLTKACTQVAEHGSAEDQEHLQTIAEHLDTAQRQALGQSLKAFPHRFDKLQAALDKSANERPGSGSVGKLGFLKSRIFGK